MFATIDGIGQRGARALSRKRRERAAPQPALALLAFMMAVGPFGDTEYTPAMPDIAHALQADYALVQFTMTSYLIGSALSQLAYGPLSDRFGRRPVMLAGAAILIAGSLLCLLSFSIWPLIGGRLVQGVGACAGGVIADAAVRDAFPAERRQRVYAKLNAAFALAPALGPVVGAYVAHAAGWHANFGLLVGLAVVLALAVWRWLPETKLQRNRRALEPRRFVRNYLRALATRGFLFYAVLGGFCVGVVYTALIGAPQLVLKVLGLGSSSFIIVAAAILVAFVIGTGSCALLTRRISHLVIIALGLSVLLVASLALLTVALIAGKHGNLAMFLVPIAVAFTGVGLVVPVSTAKAMAPFKRTAGAASSVLGFTRMGVAALGTLAMSLLPFGSVLDIPIVFLVLSFAAWLVFGTYLGVRGVPARQRG